MNGSQYFDFENDFEFAECLYLIYSLNFPYIFFKPRAGLIQFEQK
jgi:hypothetical protein